MASPNPDPKDPHDRLVEPSSSKDDLFNYFKNHSRETISYILLVLGILLLFSEPVYGGILVGIVAGIYFGNEFINYVKNWKTSINAQSRYTEMARHLIFAGLTIAFFISAPAIFLGAAVAIVIKHLFGQDNL